MLVTSTGEPLVNSNCFFDVIEERRFCLSPLLLALVLELPERQQENISMKDRKILSCLFDITVPVLRGLN